MRNWYGILLLLTLIGCGGPAFEAQIDEELAGAGGEPAQAGSTGTGGRAGSAGAAGALPGGAGGSAGAVAGSAGAATAGSAGTGGAPPVPACTLAELAPRFLETFTWQDYAAESGGNCERCEAAPCASTAEVYWTYPYELEGNAIEASVQVRFDTYVSVLVAECGSALEEECNLKFYANSPWYRYEFEPTATGWRVASVVLLNTEASPFAIGPITCGGASQMNVTLAMQDVSAEFLAALGEQTWECP